MKTKRVGPGAYSVTVDDGRTFYVVNGDDYGHGDRWFVRNQYGSTLRGLFTKRDALEWIRRHASAEDD